MRKVFLMVFIILAFIVSGYFIISKLIMSSEQPEKTIAVLPFINDSPSDSTTYFINGIEEEILNNLQRIKSFKEYYQRISTEQYKGTAMPSIHDIVEAQLNYIVQGSGQKYGKNFRLRVKLIRAGKESQLWAKSYEQEIKEVNDYIRIESEIAQSIANELKTIISPEEKQLIEKKPTTNLTAYDFYQRGRDEHTKYWNDNNNRAALQKAEDLYRKALKYDSTYAQAYTGLARVYWDKHSLGRIFLRKLYGFCSYSIQYCTFIDNTIIRSIYFQGELLWCNRYKQ